MRPQRAVRFLRMFDEIEKLVSLDDHLWSEPGSKEKTGSGLHTRHTWAGLSKTLISSFTSLTQGSPSSSLSATSDAEPFATSFVNSVHAGLDKVLGQSGTAAVLSHMKMSDNLSDPAEFHRKLLAPFGAQGTQSLERAIVKYLAIRLRLSLDVLKIEDEFDFNVTVRAVEKL